MKKIDHNLAKKKIKYVVLILIAFSIVWYEYGIKTALLSFVLLSSMLFLLINSVKAYQYLKLKNFKKVIWNFFGIIFFSSIIYFLPERLTRFATIFCAILFVLYIIYDLIKKIKLTK